MNNKYETEENEILNAFVLLFGTDLIVSLHSISSLNPMEIKIAYRKKAFETHPDRARLLGKSELEMAERFREINFAYEKLTSFLKDNWRYFKNINPSAKNNNTKRATTSSTKDKNVNSRNRRHRNDNPHSGSFSRRNLPNIELLIGQFLYYSGIVSWKWLIHAIVWQRNQRPLFGEIALEWNMLSENDITMILKGRNYKEKFGEYALHNGYINTFEHMAIIGKQRTLQRPIGEFFIKNGIIKADKLKIMVNRMHIHNREVRLRKRGNL